MIPSVSLHHKTQRSERETKPNVRAHATSLNTNDKTIGRIDIDAEQKLYLTTVKV